jgi:hypothetical protein
MSKLGVQTAIETVALTRQVLDEDFFGSAASLPSELSGAPPISGWNGTPGMSGRTYVRLG